MTNKNIAIITGATGGIGKAFVKQLINGNIDEIWCVARNLNKLNILHDEFGKKISIISLDLSNMDDLQKLIPMLSENKINIAYLINNAGIGDFFISYKEITPEKVNETINLNCTAIVNLCNICIPYMKPGSKIINMSSLASFQPLPYANLYAATKAFVTSYTRGLNVELKSLGISATAVCPGWIDTDLLPKTKNGVEINYPGIIQADKVAIKALKDAGKLKDISIITRDVKRLQFLNKIIPHKIVMKVWLNSIKKYI